jgi:hypothetical protein|tara:strand:- start:339 stop:605 length:267 start_codon:yes stop_codon:yes gene_type:complete
MNNKEYILDTTKTLFQTLANMGVTYEEEDLTFDIIENHITEIVKNLTLSGVSQQRELLTGFVRFERLQDYKYKLLPLSEKIEKYLASL